MSVTHFIGNPIYLVMSAKYQGGRGEALEPSRCRNPRCVRFRMSQLANWLVIRVTLYLKGESSRVEEENVTTSYVVILME